MIWLNRFIILLIFAGSQAACQSAKKAMPETTCIQQLIDSAIRSPWVGSIEEYEFQGKTVYAIGPSAVIADGTTLIKTSTCENLCQVGGFAGPRNSNCNGDNFFEKAVFRRKVWERSH